MQRLIQFALVLLTTSAFARPTNSPAKDKVGQTTLSATAVSKKTTGISPVGMYQLRPSIDSGKDYFYTFNIAEFGVRFSPTLAVTYFQQFITNINDPDKDGLEPSLHDGFFRARIDKIFTVGKHRLDYEPRLYMATDPTKYENGLAFFTRQLFKYSYRSSSMFTMHLWEVPIYHAYNQEGYFDKDEVPHSNPVFENRVYIMPEIMLLRGKLDICLPILWGATRYRNFSDEIDNNDAWGHKIWINPEVVYNFTDNFGVGISFESENLIANDFSEITIGQGLTKGSTTQLIFHIGL